MTESDFASVWFLRNDFGGHPERRANERFFALLQRIRQLAGDAKVRQLHRPRLRQKNVSSWKKNNTVVKHDIRRYNTRVIPKVSGLDI